MYNVPLSAFSLCVCFFFLFSFFSGGSPFVKAAILHNSYHVHWLVMNRNITIRRNSSNKKPPNSPSCISFLWHFIGRYFFITQNHIKTVDNYSPLAWFRWKGLIIIRNETKDAQCINRDNVCFVECATLIFELVNNAFIWMTSKTWPSGHHRYVFSIGWQKPSSNNLSGWEMREKIACKQSPERAHMMLEQRKTTANDNHKISTCVCLCVMQYRQITSS